MDQEKPNRSPATPQPATMRLGNRSQTHLAFGMQRFKDGFIQSIKAGYQVERGKLQDEFDAERRRLQDQFTQRGRDMIASEDAEIREISDNFARDPVEAFYQYQRAAAAAALPQPDQQDVPPLQPQPVREWTPPKDQRKDEAKLQQRLLEPLSPATTVQDREGDKQPEILYDPPSSTAKQRQKNSTSTSGSDKFPRGVAVPLSRPSRSSTSASYPTGKLSLSQHKFLSNKLAYIQKHESSAFFREAIDPVKCNAPDYFDIVKKPMDLATIADKLRSHAYASVQAFMKDFDRIVSNTVEYNGAAHEVTKAAVAMEREFAEVMAPVPTCTPVREADKETRAKTARALLRVSKLRRLRSKGTRSSPVVLD